LPLKLGGITTIPLKKPSHSIIFSIYNDFMDKSPHIFLTEKIGNFFEGLYNFILFFPYFFSVTALLRTLFQPWKGLTDQTEKKHISFNDWLNQLMFNMISSGIGFIMRSALIVCFFVFQSIYILLIPFLIISFLLLLPLQFIIYL